MSKQTKTTFLVILIFSPFIITASSLDAVVYYISYNVCSCDMFDTLHKKQHQAE